MNAISRSHVSHGAAEIREIFASVAGSNESLPCLFAVRVRFKRRPCSNGGIIRIVHRGMWAGRNPPAVGRQKNASSHTVESANDEAVLQLRCPSYPIDEFIPVPFEVRRHAVLRDVEIDEIRQAFRAPLMFFTDAIAQQRCTRLPVWFPVPVGARELDEHCSSCRMSQYDRCFFQVM